MAATLIAVVDDAAAVAREAARRFADAAREAIERRGRCAVALAGGSTPRAMYRRLSAAREAGGFREEVDWGRLHVFWGDERCVPPDHADSNFGMARATLLDAVPIPAHQVHRMEGEAPDPEAAARRYEQALRACVAAGPGGVPVLDLAVLGLGADGHTASLFPGSPALRERERLVVAAWAEAVGAWRLTVTLPLLEAARAVLFVVSGASKADALGRVLARDGAGADVARPDARGDAPLRDELPAALVNARARHACWVVDRDAAR